MTSFVLKIIAFISMFCDHFGDAFVGHLSFFNLIGRIAFPIFAFQISQAYIHTKNLKKYMLRLIIFAIISQIPFYLFVDKFILASTPGLNIFFTLLLGLVCIMTYDYFSKRKNTELNFKFLGLELKKYVGLILVFFIAILGEILNVDYGLWGVLVIFTFYLFRENKLAMIISYITLCFIKYGTWIILYHFNIAYLSLCVATIFPIIFISLYSGKQGPKVKYLLYIFYPLHLLLLYLIF